MPIEFTLSARQEAELRRVLNPTQFKQAIFQAVKRTTNKARQIAAKAVLERLTIPRKYVDDASNRYSAIRAKVDRNEPPTGTVTVRQTALPLASFKHRQTKRGVSVSVDKGGSPLLFKHGFVATVKSRRQEELGVSHKGIFVRKKIGGAIDAWWAKQYPGLPVADRAKYIRAGFGPGTTSGTRSSLRSRFNRKGFAWRLPLQQLFGPSVLAFISRDEIQDRVTRDIGNEFQKQIDSQVSRFTDGKYGTLADAAAALSALDSTDPNADVTG